MHCVTYLKCLEELAAGNNEFLLAKTRLEATLESRRSQEMDYFMEVFVPSFHLSLDEISRIHRCKQPESASHQAISAGCDIRLLSKRKQHRIITTQTAITIMVNGTPNFTKSLKL